MRGAVLKKTVKNSIDTVLAGMFTLYHRYKVKSIIIQNVYEQDKTYRISVI